jgi:mevalonate kinase
MSDYIRASAPGTMMLLGEHAVLHNSRALVFSVNARMTVDIMTRQDRKVILRSSLGEYESDLDALKPEPIFRFLLETIRRLRPNLPSGFDLDIQSDFSSTVGLGSSAAATVATVAALSAWSGQPTDNETLFEQSRDIIQAVQGIGSGADVAAAVYGGIVAYRSNPQEIVPLDRILPITVVYCGYKKPTIEVIEIVEQLRKTQPGIFQTLFLNINQSVQEAVRAIQQEDLTALGQLMNINQGFMEALGVCDATLANLVYQLRGLSGIFGSKISGSGLGDCVVGLGRTEWPHEAGVAIPVTMHGKGVHLG